MGNLTLHAEGTPICNFESSAKVPIESLRAYFTPKQSGSGDPSPSNIRAIEGWNTLNVTSCGKNLFDESQLSNVTDISYTNGYYVGTRLAWFNAFGKDGKTFSLPPFKANTQYTLSLTGYSSANDTGAWFFIRYKEENTASDTIKITWTTATTASVTSKSGKTIDYISFTYPSAGSAITYVKNIQVEEGSTATTYEPYCGQSIPVTFNPNLYLAATKEEGKTLNPSGEVINEVNMLTTSAIPVTSGDSYVFIFNSNYGARTRRIIGYDSNGDFVESLANYSWVTVGDTINVTITIPSGISSVKVCVYDGDTQVSFHNSNPLTVYGGYVDLTAGKIVQTHKLVDASTLSYNYFSKYNVWRSFDIIDGLYHNGLETMGVLSNQYTEVANFTNGEVVNYSLCLNSSAHGEVLFIRNSDFDETQSDAFAASLQGVNIVYPLKNPITYPLTLQLLFALMGPNSIWSSASNKITVDYDLHESKTITDARKRIAANQPHLVTTAAAAVNSFSTDMKAPLKSCKVNFLPVQAGSGDPSPENVRAISGWTGCNVRRTGVNLFNDTTSIIGYKLGSDTGALEQNVTFNTSDYIPIPAGQTLYLRNVCRAFEANCFFCYDANKTYISGSSSGLSGGDNHMTSGTKTTVDGTAYIRIVYANTATDVAVNYPSTVTDYTPYSGQTLSLDWTSTAGTVYGGYVDLVSGKVWKTYHKITLDGTTTNCKVNRDYSNDTYIVGGVVYLCPDGVQDYQRGTSKLFCNKMPIITPDTVSNLPYIRTISAGAQYLRIYLADATEHTDLDTAQKRIDYCNAYLAENPIDVVYPLSTPTLVTTLTPTTLKSLIGPNNLFSNTNSTIQTTYWTH